MKLTEIKDAGLANDEILKQISETRMSHKQNHQKMNRLISDAARQRKRRSEKNEFVNELARESEENTKKLKRFMNAKAGRPPLENTYPDLHKVIVELATAGASADFRRRTDILNACMTLDDLTNALVKEGYNLSRQALYLRLVPTRIDSMDGKKHTGWLWRITGISLQNNELTRFNEITL